MKTIRIITTVFVFLVALVLITLKYLDYSANPWTRDGQVAADIIQITPRVSGQIVSLPISDNQFIKKGELLFEIDPRVYEAQLEHARAELQDTIDSVKSLNMQVKVASASVERYKALIEQSKMYLKETVARLKDSELTFKRKKDLYKDNVIPKKELDNASADYDVALAENNNAKAQIAASQAALLQSEAELGKAKADLGNADNTNAKIRLAQSNLRIAELNLEFTRVIAPTDGYVTSLNLRNGSQMIENKPALGFIDANSFWLYGFFKETDIEKMRPGDTAAITLMSYPDITLTGKVESIGWGISQNDGRSGYNLLPDISATFEWIRLAQRIPVKIRPEIEKNSKIDLRVGTTASIKVYTK